MSQYSVNPPGIKITSLPHIAVRIPVTVIQCFYARVRVRLLIPLLSVCAIGNELRHHQQQKKATNNVECQGNDKVTSNLVIY